jgi:hypothetical protein
VSSPARQILYIAAIALAIAALVFVLRKDDVVSPQTSIDTAAPAMDAATETEAATATLEALGRGRSIEDRPPIPESEEEVRSAIPSVMEPHTIREPAPDLPVLKAPLDPSQVNGTGGAGSQSDAPGEVRSPGVRIAGGAIDPADGGPGDSDFYEPGMPPEYGAPTSDVSDEDMLGTDVVVASPEGDDPQVPDVPPEDLGPGTNYPAPEDSDPGIDYPAPEDSGA